MDNVWRRFDCDTDEAYSVFCEWLHSSPRTPMEEWVKGFPHDDRPHVRSYHVMQWYREHLWQQRADAYDAWVEQRVHRKYMPVAWKSLLGIQRTLTREWEKLERISIDAETPILTPDQIIRGYRLIASSELSIQRLESKEKKAKEEGLVIADFSRLSPEEQRQLDELWAKLTESQ